jgi:pyrroloquinoline quinone biosynthesis protein D
MVQLNPSAGEILSRCQQQTTIADVISDLQNSFVEADPKALAADVVEFIHEANDQGWLDLKN